VAEAQARENGMYDDDTPSKPEKYVEEDEEYTHAEVGGGSYKPFYLSSETVLPIK
jgi:hypothetical protein